MKKKINNAVFIATSLDGYIADADGKVDWLEAYPNPERNDMGYGAFIGEMDAILMGRNSFETVLGFNVPWPYEIPVYVWSSKLKEIPDELRSKVEIVNGNVKDVLEQLHAKGKQKLYIDGGKTIQSFLQEDLIDEMTITTIPVLLGEGAPLFGELEHRLKFRCVKVERFLDAVSQVKLVRKI